MIPPPLLPILRSRTQAGALTVLLLNPDLELTQTELAQHVDSSLSSVVDEVRRLEQAGLLTTRTLGRARLVRAGSGPLVKALAEVMLRTFGPLQIIAEEFGAVAPKLDSTVTELALFGSWAARYRGEQGAEPANLDVLGHGHQPRPRSWILVRRRRSGPGTARPPRQPHSRDRRPMGTPGQRRESVY